MSIGNYIVGWIRASGRFRRPEQIIALQKAGCSAIYDGADVMDAIRAMRGRRNPILAVTTLARLGTSRDAIRSAVDEVHKRGGVVLEVSTGRRSDDAQTAVQMAMDAADELTRERHAFTRQEARKAAGKRWGRAERTPIATALRIWRDTETYPTAEVALDHPDMAGWTRPRAQALLKRRYPMLPLGRKPKA